MSRKPENWEHSKCSQHFPKVSPIFTKRVHYERNFKHIQNFPVRNMSDSPFWLIFYFTGWEHCDHTIGNTAKNTLNEPLRDITVTFFGKFQNIPMVFPMGKSQSHDLEHCKCTDRLLTGNTARKLAWKILNELGMYQVGIGWVLCPFPCDVFAVFQSGTPPLVPSVREESRSATWPLMIWWLNRR